jgi:hypothetical protein
VGHRPPPARFRLGEVLERNLQGALELFPSQLEIAEDLGRQRAADGLAAVNRDRGAATIGVSHVVMAAPRSDNLEPDSLQGSDDLFPGERGILRHPDTRTR